MEWVITHYWYRYLVLCPNCPSSFKLVSVSFCQVPWYILYHSIFLEQREVHSKIDEQAQRFSMYAQSPCHTHTQPPPVTSCTRAHGFWALPQNTNVCLHSLLPSELCGMCRSQSCFLEALCGGVSCSRVLLHHAPFFCYLHCSSPPFNWRLGCLHLHLVGFKPPVLLLVFDFFSLVCFCFFFPVSFWVNWLLFVFHFHSFSGLSAILLCIIFTSLRLQYAFLTHYNPVWMNVTSCHT